MKDIEVTIKLSDFDELRKKANDYHELIKIMGDSYEIRDNEACKKCDIDNPDCDSCETREYIIYEHEWGILHLARKYAFYSEKLKHLEVKDYDIVSANFKEGQVLYPSLITQRVAISTKKAIEVFECLVGLGLLKKCHSLYCERCNEISYFEQEQEDSQVVACEWCKKEYVLDEDSKTAYKITLSKAIRENLEEEKEIFGRVMESSAFFGAAVKACEGKAYNVVHEFVCPLCEGKATAIKAEYNEHVNAECEGCGIQYFM